MGLVYAALYTQGVMENNLTDIAIFWAAIGILLLISFWLCKPWIHK